MSAPMVMRMHRLRKSILLMRFVASNFMINNELRLFSTSTITFKQSRRTVPLKYGRKPKRILQLEYEGDNTGNRATDSDSWPFTRVEAGVKDITKEFRNSYKGYASDRWKENVISKRNKLHQGKLRVGTIQKPVEDSSVGLFSDLDRKGLNRKNRTNVNEQTVGLTEKINEPSHVKLKKKKIKANFAGAGVTHDEPQSIVNNDEVKYTLVDEGDVKFRELVNLAKSRSQREKRQYILLEGQRLISDAILAEATVEALYFTKFEHLAELPMSETSAPLYKVRYKHMQLWSDVEVSPGIMAVCRMPKPGDLVINEKYLLPLTLICDNIRDPGNMGTILRTAAAVGCRLVLATKGCVDIWEPKVVRAGAGCHFRTNIINNVEWHMIRNYISDDAQVYLADSYKAEIIEDTPPQILKAVEEDEGDAYSYDDEETGKTVHVDDNYLKQDLIESYKSYPLATRSYFEAEINYRKPVVLVIGGETQGLSGAAYRLAVLHNGDRLAIPMNPGVDSLNAAVACSIILYEVKKQLVSQKNNSLNLDPGQKQEL